MQIKIWQKSTNISARFLNYVEEKELSEKSGLQDYANFGLQKVKNSNLFCHYVSAKVYVFHENFTFGQYV